MLNTQSRISLFKITYQKENINSFETFSPPTPENSFDFETHISKLEVNLISLQIGWKHQNYVIFFYYYQFIISSVLFYYVMTKNLMALLFNVTSGKIGRHIRNGWRVFIKSIINFFGGFDDWIMITLRLIDTKWLTYEIWDDFANKSTAHYGWFT